MQRDSAPFFFEGTLGRLPASEHVLSCGGRGPGLSEAPLWGHVLTTAPALHVATGIAFLKPVFILYIFLENVRFLEGFGNARVISWSILSSF